MPSQLQRLEAAYSDAENTAKQAQIESGMPVREWQFTTDYLRLRRLASDAFFAWSKARSACDVTMTARFPNRPAAEAFLASMSAGLIVTNSSLRENHRNGTFRATLDGLLRNEITEGHDE